MPSIVRSKLGRGIVLMCTAGLALFCLGCGSSSPLPRADNDFLSYFQAAHGLAHVILDPPPLRPGEDRKVQLATACEQLDKLQVKAQALPASDRQRMAREERDLVSQTSEALAEISRRHGHSPSFPDTDWSRLEDSFRLCRESASGQ